MCLLETMAYASLVGDGIMSAIAFSTKVEKEVDKDGNQWVLIQWRGKWSIPHSLIAVSR